MLRHLTFAMQHHLNALTPLVISFPAQRRLQPTDLAFGAFDHLFPPNQMVKESHLASKGKPRPCPPPSTAAVSIRSAMEVVLASENAPIIPARSPLLCSPLT